VVLAQTETQILMNRVLDAGQPQQTLARDAVAIETLGTGRELQQIKPVKVIAAIGKAERIRARSFTARRQASFISGPARYA
jgi:hypothetical protein